MRPLHAEYKSLEGLKFYLVPPNNLERRIYGVLITQSVSPRSDYGRGCLPDRGPVHAELLFVHREAHPRFAPTETIRGSRARRAPPATHTPGLYPCCEDNTVDEAVLGRELVRFVPQRALILDVQFTKPVEILDSSSTISLTTDLAMGQSRGS